MLWWHCYPTKASGRPNPGPVDPQIYPFDFRRTGFDQWNSPPGCDRSAHGNTPEQGPGPTHHRIPSVLARRGRFPPPSAGDSAVREGGSHSGAACQVFAPATTLLDMYEGPVHDSVA